MEFLLTNNKDAGSMKWQPMTNNGSGYALNI
jgi:hypothetical protein